jgi:ribosome-associated protein
LTISTSSVLETAKKILEDKKAENILILDLRSFSSFTDYFIVGTVSSSRQMMAIASILHEHFKKESISAPIEGSGTSDWVLVDLDSVVVHLMKPEARTFYQLESLWA